ncbi:MAG: flippase-like domain-containing protein [Dehalococcoidia bacterium]|nr:flippase-like domain-containing protein [Dehalococcoidia bacterium]
MGFREPCQDPRPLGSMSQTTPVSPSESENNDAPLKLSGRLRLRSAIGFVAALGIIAFFVSRLELNPAAIWITIRGADPLLYVAAFLAYYVTFPFRALRWQILLKSAGIARDRPLPKLPSLAGIIYLSWFANCLIPAKLGDAYRGYEIKQRTGASFSAAMGTVVAERAFDTVVLALLLVSSLLLIGRLEGPQADVADKMLIIAATLMGLSVVGLTAMWFLRERLHLFLPKRIQSGYLRFQDGILGSFRKAPAGAAVTFAVWCTEAARMFLVIQALSLGLSFPHAVFLSLANALLTVVPLTPGGLGLVEAGMIGLLMLAGVTKEEAVAAALLDRSISYWSIVAFGSVLFLFRRKI